MTEKVQTLWANGEHNVRRIAADPESLLVPVMLLVSTLVATATGCGARVELVSSNWASSSGERAKTQVEVELLCPRPPEQVAEPKATEPLPTPVASEEEPFNISGNTIILSIRGGDTYYHSETHVHLDAPPPPRIEERIVIHREVRVEPPRPVDERCELLRKQHEERVRKWREFPGGY